MGRGYLLVNDWNGSNKNLSTWWKICVEVKLIMLSRRISYLSLNNYLSSFQSHCTAATSLYQKLLFEFKLYGSCDSETECPGKFNIL